MNNILQIAASVTLLLAPALALAQPTPATQPTPSTPPAAAPPPAARETTAAPTTRAAPETAARPAAREQDDAVRPMAPPPPATPRPVAPGTKPLAPVEATPVAGFPLRKRRLGFLLELGYPFLDFRVGYGITDRLQILLGYRGLYAMSSAGYAGLKFGLFQNKPRTVGVSFTALGGYTYVKQKNDYDDGTTRELVGGDGGFGEAWLTVTVRRRRHGLMLVGGLRISQVSGCSDEYDCWGSIFASGSPGTLVTGFFELGWEMRFMRYASYYVAIGVDMFTNSNALPAMVRFRNGVLLDF